MIQAVRTLVLKNAAGRLIFASGVAGLILAGIDALLHASPALGQGLPMEAIVVQRALLLASMLLFALAYLLSRFEPRRRRTFIDFVLDFWQFRPQRERPASHRLLEVAHFVAILVLFHRALFL